MHRLAGAHLLGQDRPVVDVLAGKLPAELGVLQEGVPSDVDRDVRDEAVGAVAGPLHECARGVAAAVDVGLEEHQGLAEHPLGVQPAHLTATMQLCPPFETF